MKRLFLCLIGLALLLPIMAQQQGTVTMTFADCFTTYGEEILEVVFPYTYHGQEYTEPVSRVTQTITNVRNCDSVVTLTLTEKPAPVGAINGNALFSIAEDANGKKTYAYFSKSNLQYKVEGSVFRFADEQYDFHNTKPSEQQSSRNNWSDLFAYGTSGAYYSVENWSGNLTPFGDHSNYQLPAQNISGTDYDWGIYNDIQVGEEIAKKGTWRTMTIEEFKYLVDHHTEGYVMLQDIAGLHHFGMVILPDDWNWPEGVSYTMGTSSAWTTSYNPNVPVITAENWVKMENNGAVYFPCDNISSAPNVSLSCSRGIIYFLGSYAGYQSQPLAHGFSIGNYSASYNMTYDLKSHGDRQLEAASPVRLISVQQ